MAFLLIPVGALILYCIAYTYYAWQEKRLEKWKEKNPYHQRERRLNEMVEAHFVEEQGLLDYDKETYKLTLRKRLEEEDAGSSNP